LFDVAVAVTVLAFARYQEAEDTAPPQDGQTEDPVASADDGSGAGGEGGEGKGRTALRPPPAWGAVDLHKCPENMSIANFGTDAKARHSSQSTPATSTPNQTSLIQRNRAH